MAAAKNPGGKSPVEFETVFERLRALLLPFEQTLAAHHDKPEYYYLETKDIRHRGRPVFFAGVRMGKGYVSYHLMPVYACPELRKSLSPGLRKRMQGKSCFNFKAVDEELFEELRALTRRGAEGFPQSMLNAAAGASCD